MELPIDHFRLLGVSPSSSAEEVLRAFQLRLDRSPKQGFTPEVLAQRSELLRLSADLLSDESQRKSYEIALLDGASGLELSSNREVAGLLLLWEAKASYQAFKLARKALQPPQPPALGSGREADLTLVAALSCRDAAIEEQSSRRYASGADLLQEGIQLLQRMGKLPEERKVLEEDLEALLPYRILDLLSRDLGDEQSHQEGLRLLDGFVLKRGGIEGRKSDEVIGGLRQLDFELFFQQIRKFLTAKDQSELFINWYRRGSNDAGFLAAIALIASGFSYKKPQLLQEARKYLKNLNIQDFDSMPLVGCIDLLLADVQQAEARFRSSSDVVLKDWLENYPGETLAALCDYCRNWLRKDVLPGFRDIDFQSVDLEAWFAHKEVQDYVEELENKTNFGIAKAGFSSFFSSFGSEKPQPEKSLDQSDPEGNLPMPGGLREGFPSDQSLREENNEQYIPNDFSLRDFVSLHLDKLRVLWVKNELSKRPLFLGVSAFITLFILGTSISIITTRKSSELSLPDQENVKSLVSDKKKEKKITKVKTLKENNLKPLLVDTPSEDQIKSLISTWLSSKSTVLKGGESDTLSKVARPALYKRVIEERDKDLSQGQKQIINASIKSLEVLQKNKNRIAVKVDLNYKDKLINSSGETISETVIPSLKVKYVLGRSKGLWQLVDYISGG